MVCTKTSNDGLVKWIRDRQFQCCPFSGGDTDCGNWCPFFTVQDGVIYIACRSNDTIAFRTDEE